MNNTELNPVIEKVKAVCSYFNHKSSDEEIKSWVRMLRPFEKKDALSALDDWMSSKTVAPLIADIRVILEENEGNRRSRIRTKEVKWVAPEPTPFTYVRNFYEQWCIDQKKSFPKNLKHFKKYFRLREVFELYDKQSSSYDPIMAAKKLAEWNVKEKAVVKKSYEELTKLFNEHIAKKEASA